MGFDHGVAYRNICCVLGRHIRKRFVLWITLTSWIAAVQGFQSNCSASFTGLGIVTSPNYPLNYPDNTNYTWCLKSTSSDTNIRLKFTNFTTESNWDVLHIYDEKGYLTSFSGDNLPPAMTLGKTARLVFSSDQSVNRTGFNASFSSFKVTDVTQCTMNDVYWCINSIKCISRSWRCDRQRDCSLGDDEVGCPATTSVPPKPSPCGRTVVDTGYIQSPNYPQGYPTNIKCSWRVPSKSNDTIIRLQFNDFLLENIYDFVDVYDERNISKRYSGNILPPTTILGKEARIEFFSDDSNVMRGFRAQITFLSVTSGGQCMTNDTFWCTSDKKCISSNWRCDGYPDCSSKEDEAFCSSTIAQTTVSPQSECQRNGYFWCSLSLKCIPASHRCNYYIDCTYGEDEANCLRTTVFPQSSCQQSGNFWCSMSFRCTPLLTRCDGVVDCIYAEDESDCSRTTLSLQSECLKKGYFWCSRSLQCIPLSYRCDNSNNCLYGEDEGNCSTFASPCRATIVSSGWIQSPNYPNTYPNNAACSWRLLSQSNDTSIRLQFTAFTLEYLYDFVDVTDERNISLRYTGNRLPPTMILGKEARVEFQSDTFNGGLGFRAQFESVNLTNHDQCMTSDTFWCTSDRKCISNEWRCDGYSDCMSRDDELSCPWTTGHAMELRCQQMKRFWCGTSRQCLAFLSRCNEKTDCLYGEDEQGCAVSNTENTTAIVAGSVSGVVALVLLVIISIRIKKVRRAIRDNSASSNYVQPVTAMVLNTAAQPTAPVWSEPDTYASHFEAPYTQAGAPQEAESLPMDQYAPPSYDVTMIAYSNGEYVDGRAKFGEELHCPQTPGFTASSAH